MKLNLTPLILLLLVGSPALAQDALGRGDVLDNHTIDRGLSRVNELPSNVRNSQIRGTRVMQGRSFNAGLGRLSGDMQLLTHALNSGDEETYLDALYNSPWFWNNWDQSSAQFLSQGDQSYFNPNFIDDWATSPAQMYSGRAIRTYSHAWDPETVRASNERNRREYPSGWTSRQIEQYRIGQVLGTGKQPNQYDTTPIPIGRYRTEDKIGYLAASPLSGVAIEYGEQPTSALGFTAWDAARSAEDREAGLGEDSLVQRWQVEENRLDRGPLDNRIVVSEGYNRMLETIADRTSEEISTATDTQATQDRLTNQYSSLQDQLMGIYSEEELTGEETATTETITQDTTETEDEAIEEIGGILRHGEQINLFSSMQQSRVDDLLRMGERGLAKGEYFAAQKRFNQAIQFIPGHPMATVGLAHANIGAGLYLSASNVLHSLLSLQPEMIDAKYAPQLLPPRIELVRAAVAIRTRLDEKRDGGSYAFLLAYIGHQLDDEEMIVQGLTTLEKRNGSTDAFVRLLTTIWGVDKATVEQESQTE